MACGLLYPSDVTRRLLLAALCLSLPGCLGGPVVAGAGDGPCPDMQGGLGMFQFDAGTYSQTLAREGNRILTIAGNVAAGVDFVIAMVIRSAYVPNVSTDAEAVAWINNVRVGNGQWDAWVRTVTHYYNGCTPSAGCFPERYARYRDFAANVYDEMGADFWSVNNDWGAQYVTQTFPLASQPFELFPGEEFTGFIEMRNTGTRTWSPASTRLGCTQPRDGASPLAAASWINTGRPTGVDRSVAPGETGRFEFAVRAPSGVGDYSQFFGVLEEGVAWFSDQAGPPDDQLQVRVTVVAAPPCPAGSDATWRCEGNDRVRCVDGATERWTCPMGCTDPGAGAVCVGDAPGDDADGDGVSAGEDCDDADPARYPGAWDFCEDGIDQDCDGRDRLCSELVDGSPPQIDGGLLGDGAPRGVDAGPNGPGRGSAEGGCSAVARGVPSSDGASLFVLIGLAIVARRRRR